MKWRWITHLNVKAKTIKSLEENIEVNPYDLGLAYNAKSTSNKRKQMSWTSSIWKRLCIRGHREEENPRHRMRQNISKPYTDKRLKFRLHKEHLKLIIKKQITQLKQEAENLNKHLSKEDIQTPNKHMKRCWLSLVQGNTNQTTVRHHFTPNRMATIKQTDNNMCQWGHGETGTFTHCQWECKTV